MFLSAQLNISLVVDATGTAILIGDALKYITILFIFVINKVLVFDVIDGLVEGANYILSIRVLLMFVRHLWTSLYYSCSLQLGGIPDCRRSLVLLSIKSNRSKGTVLGVSVVISGIVKRCLLNR